VNLLVRTALIVTFVAILFILYVPAFLLKVIKYCFQLSVNVVGSVPTVEGMTATQLVS